MSPRTANLFQDPAAILPDYSWAINHDTEDANDRSRAIDHTANTGETGLVRQQGDPTPLTFTYSGTILQQDQLVKMLKYEQACSTRTILFTDFALDKYEVTITSFKPQRVRAAANSKGGTTNPLWYWKYTLTMEVISIREGVYQAAGATP